MNQITKNEEYNALKEECEAIFKEHLFSSRQELIMAYSELGERIAEDPIYKKFSKGNRKLLNMLARDTNLGEQTIYKAVQFYEKYGLFTLTTGNWQEFEEGKNISWNKIKTKYLPEAKRECPCEELETITRCKKCKKICQK
jgi:hypothetical protein